MMSGIRGRNTRPEIAIRQGLHREGFRFRLNDRRLPGRPDIVLPRWRAVVFVHGCFWHGHDCSLFKWPRSREAFWREKITGNRSRDLDTASLLLQAQWRVLAIWECALRGRSRLGTEETVVRAAEWIRSGLQIGEIRGEDGDR